MTTQYVIAFVNYNNDSTINSRVTLLDCACFSNHLFDTDSVQEAYNNLLALFHTILKRTHLINTIWLKLYL